MFLGQGLKEAIHEYFQIFSFFVSRFAFAVIDITDDDQVHKIVNHGGTNGERELEIPAPFFLQRDLIRSVDFISNCFAIVCSLLHPLGLF